MRYFDGHLQMLHNLLAARPLPRCFVALGIHSCLATCSQIHGVFFGVKVR